MKTYVTILLLCIIAAALTAEHPVISFAILAIAGFIEYKLGFFNDESHAENRND